MNSWAPASPATVLDASAAPAFQLYRTSFEQTAALGDGQLRFEWISGLAVVWVKLPAAAGPRELTVLIQNQKADRSGILGKVLAQAKR